MADNCNAYIALAFDTCTVKIYIIFFWGTSSTIVDVARFCVVIVG